MFLIRIQVPIQAKLTKLRQLECTLRVRDWFRMRQFWTRTVRQLKSQPNSF